MSKDIIIQGNPRTILEIEQILSKTTTKNFDEICTIFSINSVNAYLAKLINFKKERQDLLRFSFSPSAEIYTSKFNNKIKEIIEDFTSPLNLIFFENIPSYIPEFVTIHKEPLPVFGYEGTDIRPSDFNIEQGLLKCCDEGLISKNQVTDILNSSTIENLQLKVFNYFKENWKLYDYDILNEAVLVGIRNNDKCNNILNAINSISSIFINGLNIEKEEERDFV